jgi:membrane protease YdiL (CAAX protease family)
LDIDAFTERVSRKLVLRFSVGSLVAFAALAWLLAYATGRTLASLFRTDRPLSEALAVGLATGTAVSLAVAAAVLRAPALLRFREFLRSAYAKTSLRRGDMLVVALSAGVGEELLFRGAIQPLLGNGWTSLVFALLHTGLPRSRLLLAFWLYVFAVSLALGVLYQHYGLAAAMAAHAAFDLVFLLWSAHVLTATAGA